MRQLRFIGWRPGHAASHGRRWRRRARPRRARRGARGPEQRDRRRGAPPQANNVNENGDAMSEEERIQAIRRSMREQQSPCPKIDTSSVVLGSTARGRPCRRTCGPACTTHGV